MLEKKSSNFRKAKKGKEMQTQRNRTVNYDLESLSNRIPKRSLTEKKKSSRKYNLELNLLFRTNLVGI